MKKSDLNNFIKENIIETLSEADVDIPLAKITTQKANAKITNAQGFAQFILKTWNDISDEENDSVTAIQDLKIAKAKLEKVSKAEPTDIKEDEDKEPSKSDIKKTKGLAKAKEELALLTREMKSLAKKYSKAEGEEKENLVKVLKDKTKLKKELESILDKKKI